MLDLISSGNDGDAGYHYIPLVAMAGSIGLNNILFVTRHVYYSTVQKYHGTGSDSKHALIL